LTGLYCSNSGTKLIEDQKERQDESKQQEAVKIEDIKKKQDSEFNWDNGIKEINNFNQAKKKYIIYIFTAIGGIFLLLLFIYMIDMGNKKALETTARDKESKTTNETTTKPMTTNDLLAAFNDWEKTGFTESPIMLVIKNKAALTIMPENEYVKSAEIYVIAPNITPETLTDDELTPATKLLTAITPEWNDGISWIKSDLNALPVSIAKDNWQLKLEYEKKTGLRLLATQDLSNVSDKTPTYPSSTSKPSAASNPADEFEKLVVTNDKPIVFAASVEGNKGPVSGKSEAEFLGIWVTRDWDYLTDIDKRTFVKLHLNVFAEWRGKDDGIVKLVSSYSKKL